MNDFQTQLQMLNVGDFQASQVVPWNQYEYYMDQSRRCGGCFRCGGFRCGGCGGCGGCFRCGGCFGCFGFFI